MLRVRTEKRVRIADYELENFEEMKFPEKSLELFKELSIIFSEPIFNDSDIIFNNILDNTFMKIKGNYYANVDFDDIFIMEPYARTTNNLIDYDFIIRFDYGLLLACDINEIKKLRDNLISYKVEYEKYVLKSEENNISPSRIISYDFTKTLDINKKNISSLFNDLDDIIAANKLQEELDKERLLLVNSYEELKIYSNPFVNITDKTVSFINDDSFKLPLKIVFHNKLSVSRFISIYEDMVKNNKTTLRRYLINLRDYLFNESFTLHYNGKSFKHIIDGYKFKIKYNKTHSWTTRGNLHYEILNMEMLDETFTTLEFYENNNKPVGEYYNKINIKFNDDDSITLPATFKSEKNGYKCIINDNLSFAVQLYVAKRKIDAFNNIKRDNFTFSISAKSIYDYFSRNANKTKIEILEILKALKALGGI